jgi:hypothetical protein
MPCPLGKPTNGKTPEDLSADWPRDWHIVPRETSLAHAESAENLAKHLFDADRADNASKRLSRPP